MQAYLTPINCAVCGMTLSTLRHGTENRILHGYPPHHDPDRITCPHEGGVFQAPVWTLQPVVDEPAEPDAPPLDPPPPTLPNAGLTPGVPCPPPVPPTGGSEQVKAPTDAAAKICKTNQDEGVAGKILQKKKDVVERLVFVGEWNFGERAAVRQKMVGGGGDVMGAAQSLVDLKESYAERVRELVEELGKDVEEAVLQARGEGRGDEWGSASWRGGVVAEAFVRAGIAVPQETVSCSDAAHGDAVLRGLVTAEKLAAVLGAEYGVKAAESVVDWRTESKVWRERSGRLYGIVGTWKDVAEYWKGEVSRIQEGIAEYARVRVPSREKDITRGADPEDRTDLKVEKATGIAEDLKTVKEAFRISSNTVTLQQAELERLRTRVAELEVKYEATTGLGYWRVQAGQMQGSSLSSDVVGVDGRDRDWAPSRVGTDDITGTGLTGSGEWSQLKIKGEESPDADAGKQLRTMFGEQWRVWSPDSMGQEYRVGTGGVGMAHVVWGSGPTLQAAVDMAKLRVEGGLGPWETR